MNQPDAAARRQGDAGETQAVLAAGRRGGDVDVQAGAALQAVAELDAGRARLRQSDVQSQRHVLGLDAIALQGKQDGDLRIDCRGRQYPCGSRGIPSLDR